MTTCNVQFMVPKTKAYRKSQTVIVTGVSSPPTVNPPSSLTLCHCECRRVEIIVSNLFRDVGLLDELSSYYR